MASWFLAGWGGMREVTVTREMLAAKFGDILPHLDERQRRLLLGSEARALGHGGIRLVAAAAGAGEATVSLGVAELESGAEPLGRARRAGGGRKRAAESDPGLVPALLALVEPDERGDPESPLRWTVKSTRALAGELTAQGHKVSADTVHQLLRSQGFSLQGSAKTIEGKQHPDRDGQFRYINEQARAHRDAGDPVISVDAKKKEQVGQYASPGRTWRPAGEPVRVRDHDFPAGAGKVIPYGIYDLAADTGWVNVGTDHGTAEFAVESIRRWWKDRGSGDYPAARRLLITADAGGSNGYRTRAWKAGLAALPAGTGLEITCCHFPPRPAPDLAWLPRPAITGLPGPAFDALTAALAGPAAALRQAAADRRRGYRPRRGHGRGGRARHTLPAKLAAAILHHRHGLPQKQIAALFGTSPAAISRHIGDIRRLLAQTGNTIAPAPHTLATLDDP